MNKSIARSKLTSGFVSHSQLQATQPHEPGEGRTPHRRHRHRVRDCHRHRGVTIAAMLPGLGRREPGPDLSPELVFEQAEGNEMVILTLAGLNYFFTYFNFIFSSHHSLSLSSVGPNPRARP